MADTGHFSRRRVGVGPRTAVGGFLPALAVLGVVLFAAPSASGAFAVLAGATTVRVSVASSGAQGNGASEPAVVSADGRFVAFQSNASNLVAGDTNGVADVFLRDTATGVTSRVSIADNEAQAGSASTAPSISADGRLIAFQSTAANFVSGDTNGVADVFVRDVQAGTTARASVSTFGAQGDRASDSAAISADGRFVAFRSDATRMTGGDTNGYPDVFVRDLVNNITTRASVNSSGLEGLFFSASPAISADGRYVAFRSLSGNLAPGDNNRLPDIFLRDTKLGTTTRVSLSSSQTEANGQSDRPAISDDGRLVAFDSAATNLVDGDTNAAVDVFLRDVATGDTTRVSVGGGGAQGNGRSEAPRLSGDGRFVAFQSLASNLVAGDTNGAGDVFAYDRDLRTTTRLSVTASGGQAAGGSFFRPSMSFDGRHAGFKSFAANLVSGDTNGTADAFVRDRGPLPYMNLTLSKTDAADPVAVNENIRYTLAVRNAGTAPATGVVVRDPLPFGTRFVSASASQGSCSFDGSAVRCDLGTIAAGGSATATLVITRGTAGTVTNTATVSANERDSDVSNNSDTETTTVQGDGTPNLALTKKDAQDPVHLGSGITYTLGVANNGNADATGVVISDPLPANTTFERASSSQGTGCTFDGSVVTCALGTVAPGASATATLVVKPTAEGVVTNTASVTELEADANRADNSDTETTTVGPPLPSLTLTKKDAEDPTTLGKNIIYTLTVKAGGFVGAAGVTVSDPLPAGTTFVSATPSKGSCSLQGTTTLCTIGTLRVGEIARVTLVVAPTAEGVVTNTATVWSSEPDADPSDNTATETTKVTELSEFPDPTWQTNGTVLATAYSGNVVYLAGSFTEVRPPGQSTGGVARNNAAAFSATTGELLAWNPNLNGKVNALAVSGDGSTVYLGGAFTSVGGQGRNRIAAVDGASGAPKAWNPNFWGPVFSLLLSSDGSRLYAGGTFNTVNGVTRPKLVALYTANRNLVAEFAPAISYPEKPTSANVRALDFGADGTLYVGGVFESVNGLRRIAAAKIDAATGTTVFPWDPDIEKKTNRFEASVYAMAVSGSQVFLCGDWYKAGRIVTPNLASANAETGAVRADFQATDGAVNACDVSSTRLYIGGHFDKIKPNGEPRSHIASIDIASGALTSWDPGANSIVGVYTFSVTPTRLAVGGGFSKIGHWRPQQGFAQFSGKP